MDNATQDLIISIIDDTDDMTIATVREDGYPQATTVSYVNDGMTIYFGTATTSQKSRNIERCRKISLTINRAYTTWNRIQGLSIGGVARRVTDPDEQTEVGQLLLGKFPEIQDYIPFAQTTKDIAFYRIDPEVISLLDYTKGFGHTELLTL